MSPGAVAAWVAGLLTLLVVGVTLAALWPEPRPGRRRAPRAETPRAIALVVEDPAEEEHDWDGFLRDLTRHIVADEYEPRLAERAIELPREGQGEQL